MTTDWAKLRNYLPVNPFYYTSHMKDCFVYDNPYGFSIRELMYLFHAPADEIMFRFERGLDSYKFIDNKKGGRFLK